MYSMDPPKKTTLVIAVLGGVAHFVVIYSLVNGLEYSPESVFTVPTGIGLVLLGTLTVGMLLHTRLIVPAAGLIGLLSGTLYYETIVSIPPEFPTDYLLNYIRYWYTWIAILVTGGIAELGVRSGYGIGYQSLRNLPEVPMSMKKTIVISVGTGTLFAISLYLLSFDRGLELYMPVHRLMAVAGGFLVVSIAIWGLLSYGLIMPLLLSIMWVGFSVPEHLIGRGRASSFPVLLYLGIILIFATILELVTRAKWLRFLNGQNFDPNR